MRLLTKSRYRLACECPAKLNYTRNEAYPNQNDDNDFLKALAAGGFQVGALAQCYYPGGVLVETLDQPRALRETDDLLRLENVIIYEGAFQFGNLFLRADIISKTGRVIDLIEVKSKSFDPKDPKEGTFFRRDGEPLAKWNITLQDLAFQRYVIGLARPEMEIRSHLMLADKSKIAVLDGLNQYFRLTKDENDRPKVVMCKPLPPEALQNPILTAFPMTDTVDALVAADYEGKTFAQRVEKWAAAYSLGERVKAPIGPVCKKCEFRADATERSTGLRSGFHECWSAATGLTEEELDQPLTLDIWNLRKPKEDLLQQGKYLIRQVPLSAIPDSAKEPTSGWSQAERQRLQIQAVQTNQNTPTVDVRGLKATLSKWRFPLHFIDFETTRVAIPFHKGMEPYGQIAFQFSHHIVHEDGRMAHQGEWISLHRGEFPSFAFVRALKAQLSSDGGTILRYATHEKSVLIAIKDQLQGSTESDRVELSTWISSILTGDDHGQGNGRMIDLREILLRHYYHPRAGGSNSLKAILPAVIHTSAYLRDKYSQPIYGTLGFPSHNFRDQVWVRFDSSQQVIDPYTLLPPLAPDIPEGVERLYDDETISEGGAAMMAYAKSQFTEMKNEEVDALRAGLLRYCELDTLAMVMLWEEWRAGSPV